ncbi:NADH dehydrogenase subunit 5 (mitochondrion) [Liolophura japonica]|uniref:NADH dehydrogenase subunit 5 n=1 Tax=Liolophura japonica TaxID=13599 RepID=UPI0023D8216A|nr:NADH dehydrogenase subunit 5 [Liolophura japonica]WDQ44255.1 NADH dehydrogenase subunit 5 [Liolophura japonica]
MKFIMNSSLFASLFLFFYVFLGVKAVAMLMYYHKSVLLHIIFFELNSVFMTFPVIFDWKSIMFSVLVCFISSCVMFFSKSYMSNDIFLSRFVWIVMLFVLSMNFLIFIPNLISLLLGWDGLGLVSFCLVIYYQNPKSLGAGLMTAFMNRIGDVGILMSAGWMFSQGHWDGTFIWNFDMSYMSAFMILLAGMTKSAQIPFCSWLPAAMAAPTPVSALVHSSTLVTAGVFLLIRFFSFLDQLVWFKPAVLFISVSTMLMAGIAANFEMDLKKIIALSTLSQLGVMMMSIGIGYPELALIHLFTHALFKALLFLCAGNIIHLHNNNQDIRKMSQLWKHLPVTSTCFNIANLALCGIPFFAGFYSKDYIIEMMIFDQMNLVTSMMVFLATFLTVMYSVRLSILVFWSSMTQNPYLCNSDEDIYILMPLLMLTSGAILSGAAFSWLMMSPALVPFISMFDKMLVLSLTVVSGAMGGILFSNAFHKKKMMINDFFSYMWFMSLLSNNFVSIPVLKSGQMALKVLDLGWLENISGEGIFSFLINCSSNNQKSQGNLFNSIVSLSLITLSFFPLFFYFF